MKYIIAFLIMIVTVSAVPESSGFKPNNEIWVMVVDTGIAPHPFLTEFVNYGNTADYIDHHGHGTHIAGIIVHGNKGMSERVCSRVRIFSCKYYDTESDDQVLSKTVECFKRATRMRMNYISYAGGGAPAPGEKKALIEFAKQGGVTVVAAGNEGKDITKYPYYPASYSNQIPNMIIVENRSESGVLAKTSNTHPLAVSADGENVMSTLPKNGFGPMSGTSMSTAAVLHNLLMKECERK
jgi:subtilisin family serine protease